MVQNFSAAVGSHHKILHTPGAFATLKRPGIVTMWFTLIRGIQKLSVSCTLVKAQAYTHNRLLPKCNSSI